MPGWPASGYSNCGSGTSLSASLPSILEMQNVSPLPRFVESESAFQQDPKAIQTHIQVWEGWPRDPLPGQKESRLRCGEGAKREKVRVSELPPAGALKVSPWSGQASPQMAPEKLKSSCLETYWSCRCSSKIHSFNTHGHPSSFPSPDILESRAVHSQPERSVLSTHTQAPPDTASPDMFPPPHFSKLLPCRLSSP